PAGDTRLLAAAARATLERQLLRRLSWLCAQALHLELLTVRTLRRGSALDVLARLQDPPGRGEYDAFVGEMLAGSLAGSFRESPVRAGLAATATDLGVEATAELCRRLEADQARIGAVFLGAADPGTVTAIGRSTSDPHWGGRRVVEVAFESGLRLIYKPKPVGIEAAYAGLAAWLDAR